MPAKRSKPDELTLSLAAHERTLAMLAIIARQPGIDIVELLDCLEEATGRKWGKATIYADLARAKEAGVLADMRHRKGYHLTGSTIPSEDMRVLTNGLRIQAEDLDNPLAKELYGQYLKRFAKTRDDEAFFGYPVEALGNRPVTRTGTEDLSQIMGALREPILRGQTVRVRLLRDNWKNRHASNEHHIYPLQFVFNDVAWYLLCEQAERRTFYTLRLDRLSPVVEVIERSARGAREQEERLAIAKALIDRSWNFALPHHTSDGTITDPLVKVRVRFNKEKAPFIVEADRRHPTQTLKRHRDGGVTMELTLPDHTGMWVFFKGWVMSWGPAAEVLEPAALRDSIRADLTALSAAYATESASV